MSHAVLIMSQDVAWQGYISHHAVSECLRMTLPDYDDRSQQCPVLTMCGPLLTMCGPVLTICSPLLTMCDPLLFMCDFMHC